MMTKENLEVKRAMDLNKELEISHSNFNKIIECMDDRTLMECIMKSCARIEAKLQEIEEKKIVCVLSNEVTAEELWNEINDWSGENE